jgi:ABC-type branched-subunit amino acid transport system ATPase component
MTVRENLELAATMGQGSMADGMAFTRRLLPELDELMDRNAETLSGGQQQFAAIGRSLAALPGTLMLDEPTNGLAPRLVDRVIEVLRALQAEGLALLLVEQRLEVAQRTASEVCVFSHGRIVARTAADDPELAQIAHAAYLS